MNPGLVVKLRPAGPWRIGPDSGARNRVDAIYHSDSLYSAVTSAMARMGSLDEWLDATARTQTPAVCFSSCFPFLDEVVFVVPPRTIWPPTSPALMAARVRWKSARFVPLTVVQAILSGEKLNAHQWSVDGASGCLVPAGRGGPFRTGVRWNAAVDRLSGASERHATACIEFRNGSGLWTIAGFADDTARDRWQDPVKAAFRLLADTGFGGERSRGWGRAGTPEFVEGTLPEMIIPEVIIPKAIIPEAIIPEAKIEDRGTDVPVEATVAAATEETLIEAAGKPVAALKVEAVGEPGGPSEPSPVPPIHEPPDERPPVTDPGVAVPEQEPPAELPPPDPDPEPVGPPDLEPEYAKAGAPPVEAALRALPSIAEMRVDGESDAAPTEEPVVAETVVGAEEPVVVAEEPGAAEELAAADPAPESHVEAAPESHVEAAPESHIEAAPESHVEAAPESHVEAAPESHVEAAPESQSEPAPELPAESALLAATTRPAGPVLQAHWMLSLFTPAPADAVDWGRGSYTVLARGGRVDSPSGSGELKKQLQMVAEGSVLYADGVPRGAAADVAPDGFAHPVFRAGFALSIRLPEAH